MTYLVIMAFESYSVTYGAFTLPDTETDTHRPKTDTDGNKLT